MSQSERPSTAAPGDASGSAGAGLSLREASLFALRLAVGKEPGDASTYEKYRGLALAARERLMRDWLATERRCRERDAKRVHYLSLEYLMGRTLRLKQQYFFVSASMQRILREFLSRHADLRGLPDKVT